MAEPFAQPLAKLADSGIGVAAAPSGGMGMALTPDGKIPAGVLFVGASAYKIACGSVTFHWSITQAGSDGLDIPHGLGVVPVWYSVFLEGIGSPLFAFATAAADVTKLAQVQAWNPAGTVAAGSNRTGYWAAIG